MNGTVLAPNLVLPPRRHAIGRTSTRTKSSLRPSRLSRTSTPLHSFMALLPTQFQARTRMRAVGRPSHRLFRRNRWLRSQVVALLLKRKSGQRTSSTRRRRRGKLRGRSSTRGRRKRRNVREARPRGEKELEEKHRAGRGRGGDTVPDVLCVVQTCDWDDALQCL